MLELVTSNIQMFTINEAADRVSGLTKYDLLWGQARMILQKLAKL